MSRISPKHSKRMDPESAINEVFESFADSSGHVGTSEVSRVLRAAGFVLTEKEVATILKTLGVRTKVTKEDIISAVEAHITADAKDEIANALLELGKMSGSSAGFIGVDALKHGLTKIGDDTFSREECNSVLKVIDAKGVKRNEKGEISIQQFVENVLLLG